MGKKSYKNDLIMKRRKRKGYKRAIISFILLISILITLCLKLSYFNINNIVVLNNKIISKDEIASLSKIKMGSNIFYQNFRQSKNDILSNPYIMDVSISRRLPNTIEILVKERKAEFYIQTGNKFNIVDKNGIILEERDNIDNLNLVKIDGINTKNITIGKVIPGIDDKRLSIISVIADLIDRSDKNTPVMNELDLTDPVNIKASFGNMNIILGTGYDLENKLNKAINILVQGNLKTAKGYIDVSYNGNPVVSVQK